MPSQASPWTKASWRQRIAKHQPNYRDEKELNRVRTTLSGLPGLVSTDEVKALRSKLEEVYEGKSFYLQGGHCAETFDHCNQKAIQPMLDVMDTMAKVISSYTSKPVVTLGRMAGQYAKPRSSPTEVINGVTMESYKGDIMNCKEADVKGREPDPNRMVQGYFRSAACLNFIRSSKHVNDRVTGDLLQHVREFLGFGGIRSCFHPAFEPANDSKFKFLAAKLNLKSSKQKSYLAPGQNFFVSHEGLLMEYEESMTREASDDEDDGTSRKVHYNLSTHMLWIGHRTRGLEDAHVEYFRGLQNPLGVKVGPGTNPETLVKLVNRLNPNNEPGKVILITRFGANNVLKDLPPLVQAVQNEGLKIIWVCDPMHGNTYKVNGFKTRNFSDVVKEILNTINVHEKIGSRFNGLHLEMCGDDVTECLGGPENLTDKDLPRRFTSACDPRLNYQQSVALSFAVGEALKADTKAEMNLPETTPIKYGTVLGLTKPVSKLIFGTLFLDKVGDPLKLLDSIWNKGVNTFDTAAIYGSPEGKCEKILGKWIKSRNINKDQLVIVTKGGCCGSDSKWAARTSRVQILQDIEGSLVRLGVRTIDVYLLHRDDPSIPVSEIVNAMNELVDKRKILSWGVSNWSLDRLKAAVDYAKSRGLVAPTVDSTQASLAKPSGPVWPGTTHMNAEREIFYGKKKEQIAVFAWEALAKGFMIGRWDENDLADLENKPYRERTIIKAYCHNKNIKRRRRAEVLAKVKGVSLNHIVLAYLLHLSCNAFVLVGTSKWKHFNSNIGMFDVTLTQRECKWLVEGGDLHEI